MPELPEVETVRAQIEPVTIGRTIIGVTVGLFSGVIESTIPDQDFEHAVSGRQISAVARRGKYLLLHLDPGVALVVHLRMTGRLLIEPESAPAVRFQHVALHLDNGLDLRFGDQRKFGRVMVVDTAWLEALHLRLGPEPLSPDLTTSWLTSRLGRRLGPIKNALLDQHLIAGLGNIYVDEALYRCRIHPLQPANTIDEARTRRLIRAVRHILAEAINRQGTTFSTFANPYGAAGQNASFLKVYGKGGKDVRCPRCRHHIERLVVAGRGTSFCPHCQRLDQPFAAGSLGVSSSSRLPNGSTT